MTRAFGFLLLAFTLTGCGAGDTLKQLWEISREFPDVNLLILLDLNEDGSKVPEYTLPPLLRTVGGDPIGSAEQWEQNRPALLSQFSEHIYGVTPTVELPVTSRVVESSDLALDGRAIRQQVELNLAGEKIHVLMYTPAKAQVPVPAFLALNFRGNHTIGDDPAVLLPESWVPMDEEHGVMSHAATDANRGQRSSRYPLETIIDRGYGFVTAYYGDFYADHRDGNLAGIYKQLEIPGQQSAWGAVGVWAWGLSRILDYLETDERVDASRIVALGHSRLGKAALWAGAQDQRFFAVISNNSGAVGAAISRRRFGETVKLITAFYPHWFTESFEDYAGLEDSLPVDQHQLIALIAPRPVYVASASKDHWADPRGEFLATAEAARVYQLYGIDTDEFVESPSPGGAISGSVSYHLREGGHDMVAFGWAHFLDFLDMHAQK